MSDSSLFYRSALPTTAAEAFAWHERQGAFERLTPPWADVRLVRHEGIRDGNLAELRIGMGPVGVRWIAEHRDYQAGTSFTDVQREGPFAAWRHVHRFTTENGQAHLEDDITYRPPLGPLGALGAPVLQSMFDRQFAYRHRTLLADLEAHKRYSQTPLTFAISGASGMVGQALSAFLRTGGHTVKPLVRRSARPGEIAWNPERGEIDQAALEGVDVIVHLAGENVFALRWTDAKKRRILDSRVKGTALLARAAAKMSRKPQAFISASAIGLYGDQGALSLTEQALPGAGFLADVVKAWEAAAEPAREADIRTVNLRIGVVLAPQGGALNLMLTPFKMGVGGYLGHKEAWLSWIGLDDLIALILHAATRPHLAGAVNAVAPHPVTQGELAQTLGRVLHRPAVLPVPAFVLKTVMGEMAEQVLLPSARVLPEKALNDAFIFRYPVLDGLLRHVLGVSREI